MRKIIEDLVTEKDNKREDKRLNINKNLINSSKIYLKGSPKF